MYDETAFDGSNLALSFAEWCANAEKLAEILKAWAWESPR